MPLTPAPQANANLVRDKPNNRGIRDIQTNLIPQITNVADVMRDRNNIFMSESFRIDARTLTQNDLVNGGHAGDYKVDVQTITRQKSQSVTVAVVFIDPQTPNTSLNDLHQGLLLSVQNSTCYRVS